MPRPDTRSADAPRRVLHVARRFAPMVGGIERYVLDVAIAQANHGLRVEVVTLRRDVLGVVRTALPAVEQLDGIAVTRLPGVGNQRFGLCLRPDRLARAIRRADVVHLHDLRFMVGVVAIAARLTGRPLVFHTHGLLAHTTFASGLKRLLLRAYYGPMLRLGRAAIVASSDSDRAMLVADVPALARQTRTFENAVDLRRFRSVTRAPIAGRILVIGRVAERKGIDRLLAGLAALARRLDPPDWSLLIAGTEDPAERSRLDALAAANGLSARIRFHGGYGDDEHGDLLGSAWLAVFPSRAEGFGLALLEAMATGAPLIASDIEPHRALLGDWAPELVVDFDDPDAVAAAVDRLLRADRASTEETGARLRAASGPYDIERLVAEIATLYERFTPAE